MTRSNTLPVTDPAAEGIRSVPRPVCALCGGEGEFIHRDQTDRLFGAGGTWNFKRCADPECGLIWLDPMPLPEDLGKAYLNYYTHSTHGPTAKTLGLAGILRKMERGYWAAKYGYAIASSPREKILGRLLYLFPFRRRVADDVIRFLPAKPKGRLLDVGCGSGHWLRFMREMGWQVEGLDFDERAIEVARQSKLAVRCGTLERQYFPGENYDAITLQHVIEHVPHPLGTLSECARLLKSDGKLIIATPNGASLSHRMFGANWRGLEPPRHLHVFSPASLRRMLEKAGFENIVVVPAIAKSVLYESLLLRSGQGDFTKGTPRSWPAQKTALVLRFFEFWALKIFPLASDCIVAIAVKR
jgi:2-polyprenyl-3-methyl-5-hydroxy-6-metoxy-1,4-benzoquinol methylase